MSLQRWLLTSSLRSVDGQCLAVKAQELSFSHRDQQQVAVRQPAEAGRFIVWQFMSKMVVFSPDSADEIAHALVMHV